MGTPAQLYQAIQPMMKTAAPEDIRQALVNLLDLFPDFAQGHNDLGVLSFQAGEKDLARRHYEKAAHLEPDNIIYQKNLADFFYVELHQVDEALRIYVKVLELKPDDIETLLVTGHICVALHKFEDAIVFYRRVLEIEPGQATAREYLEKLESREHVTAAAFDPDAYYQEALDLAGAKNTAAAMDKLKTIVEQCPDHALAHNDLGVLEYQNGQKEMAIQHYQKAHQLQPANVVFSKNLADFLYVEQGRIEEALQLYVDILGKEPADTETLLMTGRICAGLQKFEDARDFYQRVLEIEPWNKDAATLLDQLSAMPKENSMPSPVSDNDSYANAQMLANTGQTDEAIRVLENLSLSQPDNALVHNDLGVLYLQSGQSEKTLQHYERASTLEPQNTVYKKNLADFYWVKLGRLEDALKTYVEILETQPEDIETLMSLGNVCVALQRYADARVFFDRILEIEPWNADAGEKLNEIDQLNTMAQTG